VRSRVDFWCSSRDPFFLRGWPDRGTILYRFRIDYFDVARHILCSSAGVTISLNSEIGARIWFRSNILTKFQANIPTFQPCILFANSINLTFPSKDLA
jgi:hypothetical protein